MFDARSNSTKSGRSLQTLPSQAAFPSQADFSRRVGRAIWIPVALSVGFSLICLIWLISRHESGRSRLPSEEGLLTVQSSAAAENANHQQDLPYPSAVFTTMVKRWLPEILRWAAEYELDPNLVATVMQIESCGHPSVLSRSGAIGLFQVMPYHFAEGEDPYDPDTNARRGLSYLKRSLELANNQLDLALAGYNGGHGVIPRHPNQWSEETSRYVRWGSGILFEIEAQATSSLTLEAWLEAGGADLCRRAAQALGMET